MIHPVITRSMEDFASLSRLGVDVFVCAHHWVTDESISLALTNLKQVPYVPECDHHKGCVCNHAHIVAGMVYALLTGRKLPPLYVRVHQGRIRGAVSSIELIDGHHRLRARQFLRRTDNMRWAVKGDVELLKRSMEAAGRA
jgi:hypothetical protein